MRRRGERRRIQQDGSRGRGADGRDVRLAIVVEIGGFDRYGALSNRKPHRLSKGAVAVAEQHRNYVAVEIGYGQI